MFNQNWTPDYCKFQPDEPSCIFVLRKRDFATGTNVFVRLLREFYIIMREICSIAYFKGTCDLNMEKDN